MKALSLWITKLLAWLVRLDAYLVGRGWRKWIFIAVIAVIVFFITLAVVGRV